MGIVTPLTSIDRPGCISVILHEKSFVRNSWIRFQAQGQFMKEVAILLLAALLLNGCNSSTTTVQAAAGGIWQAQMLGGTSPAAGFSFITQFTLNGDGSLSISSFQFLTKGACFPVSGGTLSGSMILTINTSTNGVTGTFSYTVASGGNTLTLTGTVTGTESGTTLSGTSIIGSWTLAGSGTGGCNNTSGSFTMTQS
jgi:hypothetical protein